MSTVFDRPPYVKAKRKLDQHINFWFKLGIASMIGAGVLTVVLLAISMATNTPGLVFPAALGAVMLMSASHFWMRPKWVDGYRRIHRIIAKASAIETQKIVERYTRVKGA
jgi:hypothetical protein